MRAFRLAVPCSDLAASTAFFEQILGIEADTTVPTRPYLHCGGFIVALIDTAVESHTGASVKPLPDDLYFSVDDLDATLARATEAGATITAAIADQPWGERSFYCTGPDGHPLCFVQDGTEFVGNGADWA